MKKKKYDRPFVEVLTLETSNGMMAGSPGGGNGGTTITPGGSAWEDDSEIENDDMGYKSYD